MKKIFVRYPNKKGTKEKKFKIESSATLTDLRKSVNHTLPQFAECNYFFVAQGKEGIFEFQVENIPFDRLYEAQKVHIQLSPRLIEVPLSQLYLPLENVVIDSHMSVSDNLRKIVGDEYNKFALGFHMRSDPSLPRLAVNSLPLIFQGWNSEPLILIRRLSEKDVTQETFDQFHDTYLFSENARLAHLDMHTLGKVITLNYIHEGLQLSDLTVANVSQAFADRLKTDTELLEAVEESRMMYSNMLPEDAGIEMMKTVARCGSQLCFYERVKFFQLSKNKRPQARILVLTPKRLCVIRELGGVSEVSIPLTDIKDEAFDPDVVTCTLNNTDVLRFKCSRPYVVYIALQEYRAWYKEEPEKDICEFRPKVEAEERLDLIWSGSQKILRVTRPKVSKRIPGLSQVIAPTDYELDIDYDVFSEIHKELHVIQPLQDIEEKNAPTTFKVPTFTVFPELPSLLSLKNPCGLRILWAITVVMLFAVLAQ